MTFYSASSAVQQQPFCHYCRDLATSPLAGCCSCSSSCSYRKITATSKRRSPAPSISQRYAQQSSRPLPETNQTDPATVKLQRRLSCNRNECPISLQEFSSDVDRPSTTNTSVKDYRRCPWTGNCTERYDRHHAFLTRRDTRLPQARSEKESLRTAKRKTEIWLNASSSSALVTTLDSQLENPQSLPEQKWIETQDRHVTPNLPSAPRLDDFSSPSPSFSPASSSSSSLKSSTHSNASTSITTPSSVTSVQENVRAAAHHLNESSNINSQHLNPWSIQQPPAYSLNGVQNPRRTCVNQSWSKPSLTRQNDRRQGFVEHLVDAATQLVAVIWPNSKVSRVHSEDGVYPLKFFIREVLRRSRASYSTLQVALYYLVKVKNLGKLPECNFTQEQVQDSSSCRALQCGRRMFLAALIVASKYLQDRNFSAKAWSKISGLRLNEISVNEMAFLQAIDWNLHVKHDEFQNWTNKVVACTEAAQHGKSCPWIEIISDSYNADRQSRKENPRSYCDSDGFDILDNLWGSQNWSISKPDLSSASVETKFAAASLITPRVTPYLTSSSRTISTDHLGTSRSSITHASVTVPSCKYSKAVEHCGSTVKPPLRSSLARLDSLSVVPSSSRTPNSRLLTPSQTPATLSMHNTSGFQLGAKNFPSSQRTPAYFPCRLAQPLDNSVPSVESVSLMTPAVSEHGMTDSIGGTSRDEFHFEKQQLGRSCIGRDFDRSIPCFSSNAGDSFCGVLDLMSNDSPQSSCSMGGVDTQLQLCSRQTSREMEFVLEDPLPAKSISLPSRNMLLGHDNDGVDASTVESFMAEAMDNSKKRRRRCLDRESNHYKARRVQDDGPGPLPLAGHPALTEA